MLLNCLIFEEIYMKWYDTTADRLEQDRTYSRLELVDMLKVDYPYVNENSYQWGIAGMLESCKLVKIGRGQYRKAGTVTVHPYHPGYSDAAKKLMNEVDGKFSDVKFTVFETALPREFVPVDRNIITFQVEQKYSHEVFRHLQNSGTPLYKLTKREKELYLTDGSVVVTDLITEAPLNQKLLHEILIEKLLVGAFCDGENVIKKAMEIYTVDTKRLFR